MTQTSQTTKPTVSEQATSALKETSRLLRLPEVLSLTGIKASSTLYDLIKENAFPKPIKVGRMSYWPAEAVHRWLAQYNTSSALLRRQQVLDGIKFKFSVNHLYDLIRENAFPKPIKVGRMSYWTREAIDKWMASSTR